MPSATRCLYLPGLGTGTRSTKAEAIAGWLEPRGIALRVVDLRVPDFRSMRVAAMVKAARNAIGGPHDRVVIIGTSLGGYVAARLVADPRVVGTLLLAPVLEAGIPEREHPWLRRAWGGVGCVPWWDKTEHRLRTLGASLLDDLDCLPSPPEPGPRPLVIVHGRWDRRVSIAGSRRYAAAHPAVRVTEVDDGHDLLASVPVVLACLQDLLASEVPFPE